MNDKIDRFHEDAGAKILEKFQQLLIVLNFMLQQRGIYVQQMQLL